MALVDKWVQLMDGCHRVRVLNNPLSVEEETKFVTFTAYKAKALIKIVTIPVIPDQMSKNYL